MSNEVVKIRRDRVGYRVPDFQNFGARIDELERERFLRMRSDPQHPKKLGDALKNSASLLDSATRQAKKTLDKNREKNPRMASLLDSAMAGMMKFLGESLEKAELELDKLGEEPPSAAEELAVRPDPATDRQLLEILLADQKWSDDVRSSVDAFLDTWPMLRPKILQAVFDAYRTAYNDIWEFAGGKPYDKITLPDPTSPEAIEDLFYIDGIHLDENNRVVALTGTCTWEDEHGLGVHIKNGKVAEVGYADIAYEV